MEEHLLPHHQEDEESPKVSVLHRFKKLGLISFCVAILAVGVGILLFALLFRNGGSNDDVVKDYAWYHNEFLGLIKPDDISNTMKTYSSVAHIAGSDHDYQQAVKTLGLWQSFGIKARLDEYSVLLTYPNKRTVEIVYPLDKLFVCTLKEAVVDDGTSGNPDAVATWNGYSASGNATGELVFANYGTFEDFETLDKLNVNFTNKIVIVKYGKIFRGNKAVLAQQRGAIGVLIYIDPADTGYLRGAVYPDGPWSSNSTVQRGSVWVGNGDPTTPGWPSVGPYTPRITMNETYDPKMTMGSPLPLIPIQPLSYGDAEPLLRALGNMNIPDHSWAGGFNLTKIGPGPVVVHVEVDANFTVTPIWNVIGTIEGTEEPDRLVLMGAHRDAWTMGAGDPISGTSVLMETARAFGELLQDGWKPRRSIVLCSWDAEEFALIGSVEFAETNYRTLLAQAVSYINLDIAVSGTDVFSASGAPSFSSLMQDVTKLVPLPGDSEKTVYDLWFGHQLDPMGTGSDHTAFMMHCAVSSIAMSLSSLDGHYEAVYHSNYDSFYWFSHFGDPTFEYHVVMAKVFGSLALRLCDDTILPFNFTDYATAMDGYLDALLNSTNQVDFTPIQQAIKNFGAAASAVSGEIQGITNTTAWGLLRSLNDRLMLTERVFLGSAAVSGKEWYWHVIFAPSDTNSYGGQTFPAIYKAIEEKDWNKADFVVKRIAQMINEAGVYLTGQLWK